MKACLLGATCLVFAFPMTAASAEPVTVVSYNIKNLFDNIDDTSNPADDTYLSAEEKAQRAGEHEDTCASYNEKGSHYYKQCLELNWGEGSYTDKLKAVGGVIRSFPEVPDVLVLPETENKKVLEDLVEQSLQGLDYQSVVQLNTSPPDVDGGTDVGMLSRLPLAEDPQSIKVFDSSDPAAKSCEPARDMVKAHFKLPEDESLYVFGVNFPAQDSFACRKLALKTLNAEREKLPEDANVVAAGAFNFTCGDLQTGDFQEIARQGKWSYPPEILGCAAPGNAFYYKDQSWQFLDMILVSDALRPNKDGNSTWFADLGSFQTVVTHPDQYTRDTQNRVRPRQVGPDNNSGESDHWPVLMRLLKRL